MTCPAPTRVSLPASTSLEAVIEHGLPSCIDRVAERGPATHAFLRQAWFAAAVEACAGRPRTVLAIQDGEPVLALPFTAVGPRALGLATIAGSYWPFRSFPAADPSEPVLGAALDALARSVRALRIGPVPDGDPCAAPLLTAARAKSWATLDRYVGDTWLFRLADAQAAGEWPRTSTLKKNRFHEKHLATHGPLDWRFANGGNWPASFDHLAAVEERSWIATDTDGRDAKFTITGHGRFWRAAARNPVLRAMMNAATLDVAGKPAAFSFDLLAGGTAYAIANSYDPAYAKHSPGKLLQTRNLLHLASNGVRTVDWGLGDSGYKQVIGAEQGPTMRDWLLVRPGLSATLARRCARLWARTGQTRR